MCSILYTSGTVFLYAKELVVCISVELLFVFGMPYLQ